MIEYHVTVRRTDKWPIPFVSALSGFLDYRITFSKMHIGVCRYGTDHNALILKRAFYRSTERKRDADKRRYWGRSKRRGCGA